MITRLMKSAAAVLCAVMVVECASAGFVWADTEKTELDAADHETAAEEFVPAAPEAAAPEAAAEETDPAEPADPADPAETDAAGTELVAEETRPEEKQNGDAADIDNDEEGMSLQEDPQIEAPEGWMATDAGMMYYADGAPVKGFYEIDGAMYYFNQDGLMQVGWQEIDGLKYYFGDDGIMRTGMQEIEAQKYYFDENGVMQTGFVDHNEKRYYFNEDGVMQTGMIQIEGKWYYFGVKGVMKTGWQKINKKKYYFDLETGRRQHGKRKIGKYVYYFKPGSGVMATGWLKANGSKYYHKDNGRRVFGAKKLGKYYYYFNPKSGKMKIGWLKLKGKHYYYDSKGHKCFGVKKINGKTYYLHPKTGARMSKGSYYLYKPIWNKSSRTKYLIYVNKKSRYVTVYRGSRKNWTIIRRCRCSIGKPSTPTPSGTYRVCSKVSHFGENKGYTVWYATGFIGTMYLLHSVVCYRGTKRVSDGRLGKAISHGCIRMSLGNASWIYSHVPRGSTVYIR